MSSWLSSCWLLPIHDPQWPSYQSQYSVLILTYPSICWHQRGKIWQCRGDAIRQVMVYGQRWVSIDSEFEPVRSTAAQFCVMRIRVLDTSQVGIFKDDLINIFLWSCCSGSKLTKQRQTKALSPACSNLSDPLEIGEVGPQRPVSAIVSLKQHTLSVKQGLTLPRQDPPVVVTRALPDDWFLQVRVVQPMLV